MRISLLFHALTRSSKAPIYGLDRMLCVLMIWSSSSTCVSSNALSTKVPVSRHGMYSNSIPLQSLCILSSVFSSANSLEAYSDTSSMSAMCLVSSSCSARVTLKEASAFTLMPMRSVSLSQCLSLSPGFRRATISGMYSWKAARRSFRMVATSRGGPRSCFSVFSVPRYHLSTSPSITSASRFVNGPSIHCGLHRKKSAHVFHRFANGSKPFWMSEICG
mmetsp:Transcript_38453/g.64634  ORF Transcript_38453/g.64634 Transcript_38453/m.64634 type:complete len:219 (+) Transcript_38453:1223-1879(+)